MADEIALRKSAENGARAQRLLEDDLLKAAFEALEADYITAWRGTSARDTDARERLWQAVNVVGKVREHLTNVVANGKLAQRELDTLANGGKRRVFGIV